MDLMNNKKIGLVVFLCVIVLSACTISYKFTGTNIDYTKIRTVSIADFPNMAASVYPPLSNMFSEALRDKFTRQTRLQLVRNGGDLDLQGEITGYDIVPLSIGTDGLGAQTRLTLTINVRFESRTNPEDDFEKRYSASETFDSNDMLSDVQDILLDAMIAQIVDQIFNDTVAKW
jgi:hypothetical protein